MSGRDVGAAWRGIEAAAARAHRPPVNGSPTRHQFVGAVAPAVIEACHRDDCDQLGDHQCDDGRVRCLTDCVCPRNGAV